jgi:hypothetical protein
LLLVYEVACSTFYISDDNNESQSGRDTPMESFGGKYYNNY